jgi:hypothetical protein
MKKLILVCFLMAALVLAFGCSRESDLMDPSGHSADIQARVDPEAAAMEIVNAFGWTVDPKEGQPDLVSYPDGIVVEFSREDLGDGIAHYKAVLQIGPGPYDRIGLHRVVKERKPDFPIKTPKTVFLQHGDAVGFEGMFLHGKLAASAPLAHSFAIYLAKNNVDVWGIDQSWVYVPAGMTDLSFMSGWGMQHCVDDLDLGMTIARICRKSSGAGQDKMNLLGYSSGGWVGYALINQETQKAFVNRNVRGYIPVDAVFKTNDMAEAMALQGFAAQYQGLYDAGIYYWDIFFAPVAYLAMTDPDGISPLAPPFTNMQTALAYGSATYLFAPLSPWYHYFAGIFDPATGMPTGLQFVTTQQFLEFFLSASAYEPTLFSADLARTGGDAVDVPFDDHLGEVTIPVMTVGSAGGLGAFTPYAATLLGSSDVSSIIVSLYPADYVLADFGHVDLFIANNAETLVWQPIMAWLDSHSDKQGRGEDISMD